jgi:RNA polymerase sigma factor (sigma-70 family)
MKDELSNSTCFDAHKKFNKKCRNTKCRYWENLNTHNNCIINMSNERQYTLQEIGEIFDITRMRVCQIEKKAIKKIKSKIKSEDLCQE